jgi:acyl CoA:acetate/3-ketoacid CoA transferase beta subunit
MLQYMKLMLLKLPCMNADKAADGNDAADIVRTWICRMLRIFPTDIGQKIAAPRITWTFSFSHNDLVRLGVVRASRIAIVASATQIWPSPPSPALLSGAYRRRAFIKELMRRAAQSAIERDPDGVVIDEDIDSTLQDMLFQGGRLIASLLGASAVAPS